MINENKKPPVSGVAKKISKIVSGFLAPSMNTPFLKDEPKGELSLSSEIRGTVLFGISVIVIFASIFIIWSSTASLSGAVIASGIVEVEGSRKTIQHLEGGIISDIRIKDGDHVKAGDVLIVLDDTRILSRVEDLKNRVRTLAAREARLRSEQAGLTDIQFDHPLLKDLENAEVKAVVDQQINQLTTRKNNIDSSRNILNKRIAQLEQQTVGVRMQVTGVREQLLLIREEVGTVVELLAKGYDRKPRLLALQRTEAGLTAQEGELLANVARIHEAVSETELQIIGLKTKHLEEVDNLLSTTQAERTSIEKIYWESADELNRISIVAPTDGVVLNLNFSTVGGVLRPGEPVMEIVPDEDDLIISARVRPQDIDEIRLGMKAKVIFPSYAQRYMHRIDGELIHISADIMTDTQTNQTYFLTKVRVDIADLESQVQDVKLTPGMPAEVYLKTRERTLIEYLLQPVSRTFERALRES